jgi:hypothetical protein
MSKRKRYDVITRDLLRRGPNSWMLYLRLRAGGSIQVVDTDVLTVTAETDRVYCIGGRGAHLVHIEMQSYRSAESDRLDRGVGAGAASGVA